MNETIVRELATRIANDSITIANQAAIIEDLQRQLAALQAKGTDAAEADPSV